MARTKATARRLMPAARSDFKRRTIYLFKIKETQPQQKTIDLKNKNKKNGQIIETINVRRKSKYFTGRNRLIFLKKYHIVPNII